MAKKVVINGQRFVEIDTTPNVKAKRELEEVVADLDELHRIELALVRLAKKYEAVDIKSAVTREKKEFGRRVRDAYQAAYMAKCYGIEASDTLATMSILHQY